MNRFAITFTVRPGTESQVAHLLTSYGRPAAGPGGGPPGGPPGGAPGATAAADPRAAGGRPMLHRTSVFMSGQRVVRVMDVEAGLTQVLSFLASQPAIQQVERALDEFLEDPRDLSTPSGILAFARRAELSAQFSRRTDPDLLPAVTDAERGRRHAILYPVRPGCGAEVCRLLSQAPALPVQADAGTSLAATALFAKDDVVVRLIEVDGSVDDALDHLAVVASRSPAGAGLARLVDTDADLSTQLGFRRFLDDNSMSVLTDRRVGVPA